MDNPFDLPGQHIHIAPFQQLFRRWKVGASEKCLPAGGGFFVITFHVRHDRRERLQTDLLKNLVIVTVNLSGDTSVNLVPEQ